MISLVISEVDGDKIKAPKHVYHSLSTHLAKELPLGVLGGVGVVGDVGVVVVDSVPGIFLPRQKEDGVGFLERVVVEVMVPPLFLSYPPTMPYLGILRFLTEEKE